MSMEALNSSCMGDCHSWLRHGSWPARIRADYPDKTHDMDDDEIRVAFADGWKYADTWDHLGDARAEYEKLADAYLELLAKVGEA